MDEHECKAFEYETLVLRHLSSGHSNRAFINQMREMIGYLRHNSKTYRTPLHRRGQEQWLL